MDFFFFFMRTLKDRLDYGVPDRIVADLIPGIALWIVGSL